MKQALGVLTAVAALTAVGAPGASAAQRVLLLDTRKEAVQVVGVGARDETLYAIGTGSRPALTVYRRTPFGPRSWPWVLQELDLRGAAISRPRPVGRIDRRAYGPFHQVAPDGLRIAYAATDDRRRVNRDTGRGPVSVEVAGLRALEPRRVVASLEREPAIGWSPSGRTLFVAGRRQGSARDVLWSHDLRTGRTVRRAVLTSPVRGRELSVGRGERVLYAADGTGPEDAAAVVDLAAGTQAPLDLDRPVLSPAGDVVAAVREGTGDLELLGFDGRPPVVVPRPPQERVTDLVWSPAGDVLAVTSQDPGRRGFLVRFVDPSTGASRVVLRRRGGSFEPRWSPDGRWYGTTLVTDP